MMWRRRTPERPCPSRARRWTWFLILAVSALVCMCGCGSNPDQSVSNSSAPRPASSSASPGPLASPAPAQQQDDIDLTNKIFQFIVSVGALTTLCYFLRISVFPAHSLLARTIYSDKPLPNTFALMRLIRLSGIGLREKSLYRTVRLFIEFELVDPVPAPTLRIRFENWDDFRKASTTWQKEKKARQEKIRSRMRTVLRDSTVEWMIETPNCTSLVSGADAVEHYFDALDRQKDVPTFLSKLRINGGFIAPLHLLTGVIANYSEDWAPIVEGYGRAVIRPGDPFRYTRVRMIQTAIFDSWLLWGPSIPVCTCHEWYGNVALQYGYGDESNSLPLRPASPESMRLVRGASDELSTRIAVQARVTGTLTWGPAISMREYCPAQADIWRRHRLILDVTEDSEVRASGGTEEQVYGTYYSAYIWIIFVMCDPVTGEPFHPEEPWRDVVPFFEHANVAEPRTLDFQKDRLARTARDGAEDLLRGEADRGGLLLRFTCAIDESGCGCPLLYPPSGHTIRSRILRMDPPEGLVVDVDPLPPWKDGDYSSCALPTIVTSYYASMDKSEIVFRELSCRQGGDRRLLSDFYENYYSGEFPDPDEVESLDNIERYLAKKESGGYGKNNYHVVVALKDDVPVGGSIFDYFVDPNAGVIEFLFVTPASRGTGVGTRILEETERILHGDAERARGARCAWVFAEMDDPYSLGAPESGFDAFSRARVWHRWGYRMLDFPYTQPALSQRQKPVDRLLLIAKSCHDRAAGSISSDEVARLLNDYLRWAMSIDDPSRDGTFEQMSCFLRPGTDITLRSLGGYVGLDEDRMILVHEVKGVDDPALSEVVRTYEGIFGDEPIAIPGSEFSQAFSSPGGLAHRSGYRYHLWKICSGDGPEPLGMASFVMMPSAGFGGYLGLDRSLRKTGRLPLLIARIEQRLIADLPSKSAVRGWYIECGPDKVINRFRELGFHDLGVPYRQPHREDSERTVEPVDLHLLYKPFGRDRVDWTGLSVDAILAAVRDVYTAVYGIADVNRDPTFTTFRDWANGHPGAVFPRKPPASEPSTSAEHGPDVAAGLTQA